MTQDEAETLARTVKLSAGYELDGKVGDLCDHILSGDMRREIENAAYDRIALECERNGASLAKAIRSLMRPPAHDDASVKADKQRGRT